MHYTYVFIRLASNSFANHLHFFLLFLIKLTHPPSTTLFPYTTLFRSHLWKNKRTSNRNSKVEYLLSRQRSEEHTSELQSLAYLVCRLLLEKKILHSTYPSL